MRYSLRSAGPGVGAALLVAAHIRDHDLGGRVSDTVGLGIVAAVQPEPKVSSVASIPGAAVADSRSHGDFLEEESM